MHQKLHIRRGKTDLGELTAREALDLLEAGFLKGTDTYRTDEMRRAKPLRSLAADPIAQSTPLLRKARQAMTSLAMGATGLGRKITSMTYTPARRLLEDFTPQIQKLVSKQLLSESMGKTQAALRDDEFMHKVFGAVYDCLPRPICRFVAEADFIEYCMERRQKFLPPPEKPGEPRE